MPYTPYGMRKNIPYKRKYCTKDDPYTKERDEPNCGWIHDAAVEVGEQEDGYPGGDLQRYRCENCGVTWKEELPQ